jgi:hypothetical protein
MSNPPFLISIRKEMVVLDLEDNTLGFEKFGEKVGLKPTQ